MNDDSIWDHLPAAPQKFFGLADDFKRNDLKRSYTKLIKRFKPDKFPREFQLIRAAFEELDKRLRFGKSSPHSSERIVLDPTLSDVSQPPSITSRQTSASESAVRLTDRHTPSDAYQLLEEKANKTVEDFFALAVLSDVVPGKSQFADWLIDGLERFPNEIRLIRLLDALFRYGPIESDAQGQLVRLAHAHANDSFFILTEPIWHRLLRELSFEEFSAALQACENAIRDLHIHARIVFYLQLLRAAMFKAPDAWIDKVAGEIQQNYELIPEYLDVDLEVTLALVAYRKARTVFQNGNALRKAIDDAMIAYCEAGDLKGCRTVAELQVSYAGKWELYADAFPIDGTDHRAALSAWHWVSWDVNQKMLVPASHDNGEQARELTEKYMNWAHDKNHSSASSNMLTLAIHVLLGTTLSIVTILASGATYAAIGPQDYPDSIVIFMLSGIGIASVLYRMYVVPPLSRFAARRRNARCDRLYASTWRHGFFRLVNSNCGNAHEICQSASLMAVANPVKSFPVLHEIANRTSKDFGLLFYDTTFLFVH